MRSVTSIQWSSSRNRRDKPLSNFRVLLTTRAAEFITSCCWWEDECGDEVEALLVKEIRRLDNLSMKTLAKLLARQVPEEEESRPNGDEDL